LYRYTKGRFTREEDAKLVALVQALGAQQWWGCTL
jgi:hypothetical protein